MSVHLHHVLALRSTSVPPTVPEILKPAAMARNAAAAATVVIIDGADIAVTTICDEGGREWRAGDLESKATKFIV